MEQLNKRKIPRLCLIIRNFLRRLKRKLTRNYQAPTYISSAPHSLKLFKEILLTFKTDPRINFISMENYLDNRINLGKINILVRHDIDTPECVEKINKITQIEEELDIVSNIYWLVSEHSYKLKDVAEKVKYFSQKGFTQGLHTIAHITDDQQAAFEKELDIFKMNFLFHPKTFTMHGYMPRGEDYEKKRLRFIKLLRKLKSFYRIDSDNLHSPYYEKVYHDAPINYDGKRKSMISEDFLKIADFNKEGDRILLLIHPGYWS